MNVRAYTKVLSDHHGEATYIRLHVYKASCFIRLHVLINFT